MKQIISSCFAFIIVLTFHISVYSQNITPNEETQKMDLISAARSIINEAKTCALITVDSEGMPRARAMDAFLPEEDFTVWLGTNPLSRKVDQIRNNSNVSLYYLEDDESGYVVIHGTAQLINDQKEKDKRWKKEWEAFYKNRSTDYLLIKVTPKWMEIVSYSNGIVSESDSWAVPRVDFE